MEKQITGKAIGGKARAEKLSKTARKNISISGANAKWEKVREIKEKWGNEPILKATHSGTLEIGVIKIQCFVLEDGTRILSREGFLRAIGRKGKPKSYQGDELVFDLPIFLRAETLKPFIDDDLIESSKTVLFSKGNSIYYGYKADLLPKVCSVFLDAKDANELHKTQIGIYERCKLLIRGFATVGITALVDEATNYQEVRDRRALQEILDKFLLKEHAKWAKRFPIEFYQEIFRLRGWQWRGMKINRPSVVGKYTLDLVYERLVPTLREELEFLNPKDEKGRRKVKHHQFLTDDIGHPKLAEHLYAVLGLMRASGSWEQFYQMMQRAFPKFGTTRMLPFTEDED